MSEEIEGFEPENAVEETMLAAARDPERFGDFLEALRAGDIFIPRHEEADDDEDGDTITLPLVRWEGREAVPVFSSLTRLHTAIPDCERYMAFHFADLASRWGEHWMILNPGNAVGLPLSPAAVRGEAEREVVDAGTELMIGEPATLPPGLREAVVAHASDEPLIVAAHVAQVYLAGEGEGRLELVVGIEIAPGADARQIAEVAARRLRDAGTVAGVMVVDRDHPNTIARWMLERDVALWRRAG